MWHFWGEGVMSKCLFTPDSELPKDQSNDTTSPAWWTSELVAVTYTGTRATERQLRSETHVNMSDNSWKLDGSPGFGDSSTESKSIPSVATFIAYITLEIEEPYDC